MIRALALALLLAAPALAQPAPQPQASVTLDPDGPVTVGTPVRVTATVLVPSYMPQPPVWPDLQIADAVTRLPERATHPVTRRIGGESWSGIARTWEIIPQRPADYDLGAAEATVTYADPETNAPVQATVALPGIAFTATVPPGAEGIDPFLAAASLTLAATVDGLPDAPRPGDAFTLTLTTTASGPPAMLLPPLAGRLPTPPGLRAYPRQPALTDGDPASRTEAVAYVIKPPAATRSRPLPGLVEHRDLDPRDGNDRSPDHRRRGPRRLARPGRRRPRRPPPGSPSRPSSPPPCSPGASSAVARARPAATSPSALRRALLASARTDPPETIRRHLAAWQAALPAPAPPRRGRRRAPPPRPPRYGPRPPPPRPTAATSSPPWRRRAPPPGARHRPRCRRSTPDGAANRPRRARGPGRPGGPGSRPPPTRRRSSASPHRRSRRWLPAGGWGRRSGAGGAGGRALGRATSTRRASPRPSS